MNRKYDLEERLLQDAAAIIRVVQQMPVTRAGNHVGGRMLRSGTSPLANHGEAESAEAPADFVHKLRLCFKELRGTSRWLRLTRQVPLVTSPDLDSLPTETDELIRIFVASLKTANTNRQ